MMKKIALALLATAAMTAGARAQLLVGFDVNGTTNGTSPTATVSDPNVTSTLLLRGSGVTTSTTNNSFSSSNWSAGATSPDFSNADGKYIDFIVTPQNGGMLSLTSLQYAVNGSNTAPNQGQWAYSLDGGQTFTLGTTANGGIFTIPFTGPTALQTWTFAAFSTNTAVDFRFTAYGTVNVAGNATAPANTGVTRIFNIANSNDLVLNGTFSPAPEPTTFAMLGGALGLLGLIVFRRNRAA